METAATWTPRRSALLEEDLRSPCTEEIAVFRAFSRARWAKDGRFVVLDTAPTGHTMLLLDAAGAYHREVIRTAAAVPGTITTPLMRLQDPRLHAGADRHACRSDAGPGGGGAAGRPAPCRHRALRLGDQRKPLAAAAPATRCSPAAHSSNSATSNASGTTLRRASGSYRGTTTDTPPRAASQRPRIPALPTNQADLGEDQTVSYHRKKTMTAGDPARAGGHPAGRRRSRRRRARESARTPSTGADPAAASCPRRLLLRPVRR